MHLASVKSIHPKARHHCYAYRILEHDEITEYGSDAGEPSGSAGAPILGELRRRELLNVCAIVVRYFGGTKLGIPGLIHAYRESTSRALDLATKLEQHRTVAYRIAIPIALQPMCYDTCKQMDLEISDPVYTDQFSATIAVPLKGIDERLSGFISGITGKTGDAELIMAQSGMTLTRIAD
jgi:uncharacterized YigZ family protein